MKVKATKDGTHLISVTGFACNMAAGDIQEIPADILSDALVKGCVIIDVEPIKEPIPLAPAAFATMSDETEDEIRQAILKLVIDNDASAFKADGTPKIINVMNTMGKATTAKEIEAVWAKMEKEE